MGENINPYNGSKTQQQREMQACTDEQLKLFRSLKKGQQSNRLTVGRNGEKLF